MATTASLAVILALIVSAYSAITYIVGVKTHRPELVRSARNGVIANAILNTAAIGFLLASLLGRDFQLEYVASYSDGSLPFLYTLSAVWAGGSGSLLFWSWILAVAAAVMVLQRRDAGKDLIPYAASVTMIIQVFFLILLIAVSNPFKLLPFVPVDGQGLNPLLQNPGMALHPPTQLMGYSLFAIPFALGMAALLTGNLGDDWIVASRRWTIFAWIMLGIGNLAGGWWAYYVLGWGGMWAWDPVENAGLLPWLTATALLHSAMMQRRRGILKRWNVVLVILTFVLSIFGTFLTRSGVLGSVHSFAESAMGPFFMAFMGISLVVPFGLLWYRNDRLKSDTEIESTVSRESTFLLNNLLLVSATFAVFVGTIFPLLSEWVRGVKITVGPPFYNQVMVPIFLGIVLLTGICTTIGWRRNSLKNLLRNFTWPLAASLVMVVVLVFLDIREWYALLAFWMTFFVIATIFYEWVRGVLARHRMRGENFANAFLQLILANRPRYGGYIVHLGIMLLAIGLIGSQVYDVGKEVTLQRGESATVNNYTLTYQALDKIETEKKLIYSTTLDVQSGGKPLGKIIPEKFFHTNHGTPVTVAAVRSTMWEDLYVVLIGWGEDGSASFKIMSNPLVNWMWLGAVVLNVGGLIAFWPERKKSPVPAGATGGKR